MRYYYSNQDYAEFYPKAYFENKIVGTVNGDTIEVSKISAGEYLTDIRNLVNFKITKNTDGTYEMVNETRNTYYFDTDGKLAKIKDGNEINTTITRDANKITLVKDNETLPSVITLDSQGRVTSSIDYKGKENKFFYGMNGELSKVENDEGRNVNYTYNLNKNISKIETARGKVSYEYDDKNRITKETDSAGNSATLEYDDNYETGIIMITRTDRNGNKSYITTDFFGNVLKTVDALGYEANYIYDDNRNLIKIVDKNGNVSNRTFNDMNLITQKTQGDGSVVLINKKDTRGRF